MEDDLEPDEIPVSANESEPREAAVDSVAEVADGEQDLGGDEQQTVESSFAAETEESEVVSTSEGETHGEDDAGIPQVSIVSPDKIIQGAPSVSHEPRGGFRLPQNPIPTPDELLLEQVFGKSPERPTAGRRVETAPIRIGIPSDSIAESRKEDVIPRIVITVSLAHARDMFDRAVEEAIKRAGPAIHAIARHEVETAAFRVKAEQRAADYRLRGPYFT